MTQAELTADTSQVEELRGDIHVAGIAGLEAVARRAEEVMREEARPISRRLAEGVSAEFDFELAPMEARIGVEGVSPELPAREATLHESSGATRGVTLRPRPAYDFAEVVATGRPAVRPMEAKALLIPVTSVGLTPSGKPESYVEAGGELYVVRKEAKAVAPNPYDERAGVRVEAEAEQVASRAVEESLAGGAP